MGKTAPANTPPDALARIRSKYSRVCFSGAADGVAAIANQNSTAMICWPRDGRL
jgi:hypothetical protein